MKSGYKILWTEHALIELSDTYDYLELHFTKRELKKLSTELDRTLKLISQSPHLFPISELKGVRRVVIKKFNTLYYREKGGYVEIISFFSNRKKPIKEKF